MPTIIDKIKDKLSSGNKKDGSPASPTAPSSTTTQATPAAAPAPATTPAPVAAATTPAAATPVAATPATTADMSYTGKCHCGHHTWTVELQPDQQKHILCHCDTCKILGGGAFTMNQIIPKSQLKITSGGEPAAYTYYGDSGKAVNCYYCPKCTTHIYHHQEVMGADTIIARTGLLTEGRKNFEVGAEIYGKDKMKWEKEIATTFDVLPPS